MNFYNESTIALPSIQVSENIITGCNQAFKDLTGLTNTQLINQAFEHKVKQIQPPNKQPVSVSELINLQHKQVTPILCHAIIDGNDRPPLHVSLSVDISTSRDNTYLLYFQAINKKDIAKHYGLPSGWAMRSRAQHLTAHKSASATQLALLKLNIDNFSMIAHRHGSEVSDLYLEKIGSEIQKIVQPNIAVQYNNGKFGVLIENTNLDSYWQFKTRTMKLCKELCQLSETGTLINRGGIVKKSFSIGISAQFNDYKNYHAMEIAAEIAMQSRPNKYTSGYHFANINDISKNVTDKLILDDLPDAVFHNKIEVLYQPQYDIKKNALLGFEAISYWPHKALGNISNSILTRLTKKIDLNLEFDLSIFKQVCAQIVNWIQADLAPHRIAINFSYKTTEMPELLTRIKDIIKQTNCPINLLEIEITKTAKVNDEFVFLSNLKGLKQLGFMLTFDKFGSGYSCLEQLKKYHSYFSRVKFDNSLTSNINSTQTDQAFIKKVVELGRLLNLEILAEGVESQEQLVSLFQLNYDVAQGPYFDDALCTEQATKLIE